MYDFINEAVSLKQFAFISTLCIVVYFAVFIAVLIDFFSGMRRSRRLGIRPKSYGFRRSIRKFNDYVLFILMATIIDFLLYLFATHEILGIRSVPYLTLGAGIVAIIIEIKSVWENTDKDRQRDIGLALDNLADLARTKGEAEEILRLLQGKMESKK